MTYAQTEQAIAQLGYHVLAQTRHPEGRVSYDAMKGTGRWPHGRKLAKGAPRKTPYQAIRALHRACIERDLPRIRKTVKSDD